MTTPPIIDEPQLLKVLHKVRDGTIRTALWALWTLLVMPTVSFLIWLFAGGGIALHASGWLGKADQISWVGTAAFYLAALMSALVLMALWSWSKKREARRTPPGTDQSPLTREQMALAFGVCEKQLHSWQANRLLVIHHAPCGMIAAVEPRD